MFGGDFSRRTLFSALASACAGGTGGIIGCEAGAGTDGQNLAHDVKSLHLLLTVNSPVSFALLSCASGWKAYAPIPSWWWWWWWFCCWFRCWSWCCLEAGAAAAKKGRVNLSQRLSPMPAFSATFGGQYSSTVVQYSVVQFESDACVQRNIRLHCVALRVHSHQCVMLHPMAAEAHGCHQ